MKHLLEKDPVLSQVAAAEEVLWFNPKLQPVSSGLQELPLGMEDIRDAEARLARFAPFIEACFPETAPRKGLIESPLTPIPAMQKLLEERFGAVIPGKLLLKQDSHLAIAGSVKARGGIYEVLKHTEDLAMEAGLLKETDNYAKLATPEMRKFFSKYTVQVGSTGNLGMSIGIASAAVGYKVIVHMSVDAKQWKKDLLRSHGVQVIEYEADYGEAVKQGRAQSDADPMSYFVDDENSKNLFLGYAVAALRLQSQLKEQGIAVDAEKVAKTYETFLSQGHWFLPGAEETVKEKLFGKYRLFLASNGTPVVQQGRMTSADLYPYFEQSFISEEIGYNKPAKEYFQIAFSRIPGFDPAECVMVGDSLTGDIQGGKNAGLRTVWVNPHHKVAPDHLKPDYEIEYLADLPKLLEEIE